MLNKGWIDIHAHVLPGVDDGARDWEESRALLKLAYDQGIRHIIATPHYTYKQDVEKLQDLGSRLDLEAKSIAQDYGISLGQEIMYFESLTAYLDQNKALTLAGSRYVLVEFEPSDSLGRIQRAVRQLIQASYFPVIAHVERYTSLNHLEDLAELVECGAYLQMNSRSLDGGWTDQRARRCKRCLRKGIIHFIATDMHNPWNRPPDIKNAISWIERNIGGNTALQVTMINPEFILLDRMI